MTWNSWKSLLMPSTSALMTSCGFGVSGPGFRIQGFRFQLKVHRVQGSQLDPTRPKPLKAAIPHPTANNPFILNSNLAPSETLNPKPKPRVALNA